MSKVDYRISKVTDDGEWDTFAVNYNVDGYHITLTNVENPFDYFTEYVPSEAYTKEEFAVGRVIELEVSSDE